MQYTDAGTFNLCLFILAQLVDKTDYYPAVYNFVKNNFSTPTN